MTPAFVQPVEGRMRGFAAHCLVGLAALLGALPATAGSNLLPASLRAVAGPIDVTQVAGPLIVDYTDTYGTGHAGVWSDYGINKAGSEVALVRYATANTEDAIVGNSTWTDLLTIYTPDAPADAWIHLVFSIHLDGTLTAVTHGSATAYAQVNYQMWNSSEGSWILRPAFTQGIVGPDSHVTIDEMLSGDLAIQNGHRFNLISELGTYTHGYLAGPPDSSTDSQSAFGDTARWMGGAVWIGDAQASHFSIMSESGFDYGLPVPEPASGWLWAAGLLALAAARRQGRTPRR